MLDTISMPTYILVFGVCSKFLITEQVFRLDISSLLFVASLCSYGEFNIFWDTSLIIEPFTHNLVTSLGKPSLIVGIATRFLAEQSTTTVVTPRIQDDRHLHFLGHLFQNLPSLNWIRVMSNRHWQIFATVPIMPQLQNSQQCAKNWKRREFQTVCFNKSQENKKHDSHQNFASETHQRNTSKKMRPKPYK